MSVRKPTPSTVAHTTTCQLWALDASSSISLPMKPGSGGSPEADAAVSSSSTPSSAGCATGVAGSRLSAASPRCAATSSTSRNSAAITSVLFTM